MGQAEIAERVGRMVRKEIPAAAAAFLTEQPLVVLAAADDAGRMWTSLIAGQPGFVRADDARTITIGGLPAAGDPLRDALQNTRPVGLIAVQPQTRRRMRVNGTAEPISGGVRIRTAQVYSNCPKYITRRHVEAVQPPSVPRARRATVLSEAQRRTIAATDTFFIGSADVEGNPDASHRGGNPGFLQILSPTRLRWPDYRGNSMFMTLGNISANPRCSLLIPDWHTGATLALAGTAEIVWEAEPAAGAQCWIDFTVTELVELSDVSSLRWGAAELSPANPA
ncbi:pyridoxamine 5'-phosphate oxidase family protein [Mycobacterium aquaticum]|uniref:Pyridoxamine 5-phosphate oxidase n=1 Tax=Mycobacterium aquaticum TaxID=1927124 RepID=A0A1X0A811_9MYCO|nr:pyridoxamine 5'-phosphate oxidase family protein [Mycobacterium aquaticum]ORA26045.1 pyridoxamine 5-phosphate oxidase [Mycobacterium aquaticum]